MPVVFLVSVSGRKNELGFEQTALENETEMGSAEDGSIDCPCSRDAGTK